MEETRVCGKSYSGGMATGNKFLHLVVVGRDQQPPKHYPGTRCSSYLPYAAMDSYAAFMEREGGREGGRDQGKYILPSACVHAPQSACTRAPSRIPLTAPSRVTESAVTRDGERVNV